MSAPARANRAAYILFTGPYRKAERDGSIFSALARHRWLANFSN